MVRLAKALSSMGHDVGIVFNLSKNEPQKDVIFEDKNIKVSFFFMDRLFPSQMIKFRRKVKREKYQIIHTHRDPALKFVFFSLLGLDIPLVAQRGTTYRPNRLVRFILKSSNVRKIIAVSYAVKDVLVNCGIFPSKIKVIYGSADPDEFSPHIRGDYIKREFGIPDNAKVVGMVAALVGKKGYPVFLKAAREILNKKPCTYFLMVGEGKARRYEPLIKELDLLDKAIFTGHRHDVAACISVMDILVCASLKGEGLTGSLREAMMMEKPVVSTSISGNPEAVEDKKIGLLVAPADEKALADAILGLLDNKALSVSFAKKARTFALSLFSDEKRASKVEKVYKELLQ